MFLPAGPASTGTAEGRKPIEREREFASIARFREGALETDIGAGVDVAPVYPQPPRAAVAVAPTERVALTAGPPLELERTLPQLRPGPIWRSTAFRRAVEMAPALVALVVITSLVWGPIFVPVPFALVVTAFHAFWFFRAHMTGIHAYKGFRLLRRYAGVDWRERYERERRAGRACLRWEDVRHVVVIPNYTEGLDKLRKCLDSLAAQEVASQIIVVLALEEREGEEARRRARVLVEEYGGRLGGIFATYHPWGLPGEVAGKSSNENWAARRAKERLVDGEGLDIDHLTITSCDADTVFDRKYFACLTYKFATDPNRYRRFWQGPIFYYNNIWHVPAPLRLQHGLSGLNHLGRLSREFLRMNFPQSTYSLSLRMAHEVGYWDPDVIPEDWHMFLKCFYSLGGEVDTEVMFTPVYMDGIRSRSYLRTFANYFDQVRRHAWGCADIPYAAQQVLERREVPLRRRLGRLWALCQSHILWSTQWFLVTGGRAVPLFLVSLGVAELPGWFPLLSRWLLLPCAGPLILIIVLDALMRPRRPPSFYWWLYPVQYAQYFFMAIITFFASALPALDAQQRLARGKRLEYRVTEKA